MPSDESPSSQHILSLADEFRLLRHKAVSERRFLRRLRDFIEAYRAWAFAGAQPVTERLARPSRGVCVAMPWGADAVLGAAQASWVLDEILVVDPLANAVRAEATTLRHPPTFRAEEADPWRERARARRVLQVLAALRKAQQALGPLALLPVVPGEETEASPAWPAALGRPALAACLRRGITLSRVEMLLQDDASRWIFRHASSERADALDVSCDDRGAGPVSVPIPPAEQFTEIPWSPQEAVPPGFEPLVDDVARHRFEELAATTRSGAGLLVTDPREHELARLIRGREPDAGRCFSLELPTLCGLDPGALLRLRERLPPAFAEFRAALARICAIGASAGTAADDTAESADAAAADATESADPAATDAALARAERELLPRVDGLREALESVVAEADEPTATVEARVLSIAVGEHPPLLSWSPKATT